MVYLKIHMLLCYDFVTAKQLTFHILLCKSFQKYQSETATFIKNLGKGAQSLQNKLHCAGNKQQKKKSKFAVVRLKSIYFADITRIKRPQREHKKQQIDKDFGGRQHKKNGPPRVCALFGIQHYTLAVVKPKCAYRRFARLIRPAMCEVKCPSYLCT